MLVREISRHHVVTAILSNQNKIGTGAVKLRRKQQARVRDDNCVGGMRGINMD
jgi:hypothetical protein